MNIKKEADHGRFTFLLLAHFLVSATADAIVADRIFVSEQIEKEGGSTDVTMLAFAFANHLFNLFSRNLFRSLPYFVLICVSVY